MEYLLILGILLCVTYYVQCHFHIKLYHSRAQKIMAITTFALIGVMWDSFAIWRGHWVFPPGKNLGITIGLMPLEEYLFMLIVPYAILVVYKVVTTRFPTKAKRS
jgi:lycopene cyclase domain-containing protein